MASTVVQPPRPTRTLGLDEESGILFAGLLSITIGIILRKASSRSEMRGNDDARRLIATLLWCLR